MMHTVQNQFSTMRTRFKMTMRRRGRPDLVVLLGAALLLAGCLTDVPPSPEPGVLRVTLQADPADSTIEMLGRTQTMQRGDAFILSLSNGAAYRDSSFVLLMSDLQAFRPSSRIVNIVERSGGDAPVHKLFETLVPPAVYDSLKVGVEAVRVRIGRLDIPIALPPGEKELMTFHHPFEVMEGDTTVVELVMRPLASVVRFRDQFLFRRQIEISRIVHR